MRYLEAHYVAGIVFAVGQKLFENAREFLRTVIKLKPQASKGTYVKSVFMSATMSPSIEIDPKSIDSAN